jgi:hypothetical protein
MKVYIHIEDRFKSGKKILGKIKFQLNTSIKLAGNSNQIIGITKICFSLSRIKSALSMG